MITGVPNVSHRPSSIGHTTLRIFPWPPCWISPSYSRHKKDSKEIVMKYFPIHLLMGISFAAVGLLVFINLWGKGKSPNEYRD